MAESSTPASYGTVTGTGRDIANRSVDSHNAETETLLRRKPGTRHWLHESLRVDVRRDWADIMLLGCYVITGILDSASISTWGAFVSMQTGKIRGILVLTAPV